MYQIRKYDNPSKMEKFTLIAEFKIMRIKAARKHMSRIAERGDDGHYELVQINEENSISLQKIENKF